MSAGSASDFGNRQAGLSPRRQFRRPVSAPDRAEHGNVGQFLVSLHAPQQKAAAAHVAAPDEIAGEAQALAEMRKETFRIFSGGDAPKKDEFVDLESRQCDGRFRERFEVTRFGDIDGHGGKLPKAGGIHGRIPRQQSARGGDYLGAGCSPGRPGEVAGIGQLSAKVQTAAKGEYFAQSGVADLHAAGEFEFCLGPQKHPRPESAGVRGREEEYPIHGQGNMPAPRMGCTKPKRFIIA